METEILHSLKILKEGKTLVYPTDTVWGIGCDATSEKAVNKVFTIKKRPESKSLIILVNSFEMLQNIIKNIPKNVLEVLKKAESPTTIIYQNPQGLAKNVIAADNTVAIRIVQNEFCKELIYRFQKPIVSTSANISGSPTPKSFKEIEKAVLDSADYVVNLQREEVSEKSSTILKVEENGKITVLRK